jgi:hypothetical protein
MTQVVRFWEARVADSRLAEALTWVRSELVPAARAAGAVDHEVVASEADAAIDQPARIVLLTRWVSVPTFVEPVADTSVVARAHAWNFHSVDE